MTTLQTLSRAGVVGGAGRKNPRLVALGGGEAIAHAAIMRWRLWKTPQLLRDKLLCIENRRRSLECGLSIVRSALTATLVARMPIVLFLMARSQLEVLKP